MELVVRWALRKLADDERDEDAELGKGRWYDIGCWMGSYCSLAWYWSLGALTLGERGSFVDGKRELGLGVSSLGHEPATRFSPKYTRLYQLAITSIQYCMAEDSRSDPSPTALASTVSKTALLVAGPTFMDDKKTAPRLSKIARL